ncbi:uncharacterized protein LY79DRAFT_577796 [Colletotrichum navitas]|uniref:Uncharacterized protein n=1 Tax=Colletotrichum navitas TaxID=681940 RepID=A0AAD8Q4S1_9PEZI|nr:uncharacterized protein LY79DRAFT_577796 [Colletotrichum navitas]KAK1595852.1 hypothetical protein LY79DRAFT_577796 [Colletotrichum navitas]
MPERCGAVGERRGHSNNQRLQHARLCWVLCLFSRDDLSPRSTRAPDRGLELPCRDFRLIRSRDASGSIGLVDGLLRRSGFNAGIESRIPLIDWLVETSGYGPKGPQPSWTRAYGPHTFGISSGKDWTQDICSTLDLAYEATAAARHRSPNPMYHYTGRRGRKKGVRCGFEASGGAEESRQALHK